MSDVLKQLRDEIAAFQDSPQGYAARLRHELARITLEQLRQLSWSQSQLALAAEMSESSISRLIHSKTNWETETAGRVLHAMRALPSLTVKRVLDGGDQLQLTISKVGTTNGKEEIVYKEAKRFRIVGRGDESDRGSTSPNIRFDRPAGVTDNLVRQLPGSRTLRWKHDIPLSTGP